MAFRRSKKDRGRPSVHEGDPEDDFGEQDLAEVHDDLPLEDGLDLDEEPDPEDDEDQAGDVDDGRGVLPKKGAVSLGKPRRGNGPGGGMPPPGPKSTAPRYSVAAKKEHLHDFAQSSMTLRAFCKDRGLNTKSFCIWRKQYKALGEAGLIARPNKRNSGGRTGRVISAEERRALVEAYLKLKLPQAAFAKTYGVSVASLQNWLRAYNEHGPKGLEPKKRGRKPGNGGKPMLPTAVQASIVETKRRFPTFGLKKVRDYLKRFFQVKVSTGGVRNTLEREGIEPVLPFVKKRRRSADKIRRFERALPMDLWQTDITSYVLTRESRRVYLTAYVDDYSRYVVAFKLKMRQTAELVCDTLLEGTARFGKPKEVLSDQGRQYYAWRGKTEFQKLLDREGIRHVVARAHHPETVGKCERLWGTIGKEFWERARPQDLDDAAERLAHFISHYNHFRPHQSLDGLVPADRFFGQESAVRKQLEEYLAENELLLALDETPRKKVFLMGQVGEQKVSLRGERGRLVIETEKGLLEAMDLEEVGNDGESDEHEPGHESTQSKHAPEQRERDVHGGVDADNGPDAEPVGGAGEFDDDDDDADDSDPGDEFDRDRDILGPLDLVGTGRSAAHASLAETPLQEDPAAGDRGEGADRSGLPGGATKGARDVFADPRLVARQEDEAGGGKANEPPGTASVAVESARPIGDDSRPLETAASSAEGRGCEGLTGQGGASLRSGTRSGDAEEDDQASRAGSLGSQPGECCAPAIPVLAESAAKGGADACTRQATQAEQDQAASSTQPNSADNGARGSWRCQGEGVTEGPSQGS